MILLESQLRDSNPLIQYIFRRFGKIHIIMWTSLKTKKKTCFWLFDAIYLIYFGLSPVKDIL